MISGKQDQWNLGLTDFFQVLKTVGKFKKWVRYVLKINESIINTSAIIESVQYNKKMFKIYIYIYVVCDLQEFKEIHNCLNAAPPRSMHPRLSGDKSVGLTSFLLRRSRGTKLVDQNSYK